MAKTRSSMMHDKRWKYQYDICNQQKMNGSMGWFYRLVLRMAGTKITKESE